MSQQEFITRFAETPEQHFFSPGRVNLIGEHIDYCGGRVLPMAINRGSYGLARRLVKPVLEIYSKRFNESVSVPLNAGQAKGHWSDFAVGVVSLLGAEHKLHGVQLYVSDDIDGGGLSSSASFSLLIAQVLLWAAGVDSGSDQQRLRLARLCQQVEHDFVGVSCGIMDQASIALGGIVSLDCTSLQFQRVPALSDEYQIIVMDTCHPRTLAGSKYNERIMELKRVQEMLRATNSLLEVEQIDYLSLIELAELPRLQGLLGDEKLQRRLGHVVSENHRVTEAMGALAASDFTRFGELMNASHDSLHHDYEVTGDALMNIVSISREQPGCLGARMTGAGFGGCALALVAEDAVDAHNHEVSKKFAETTGVVPKLFSVSPGEFHSNPVS